jgi:hypothetical protein
MRRLSIVPFGSCSLIYRFQLFLNQLVLDAEVFSETIMEPVPRFNLGACLPQFLIAIIRTYERRGLGGRGYEHLSDYYPIIPNTNPPPS